MNCFKVNYVRYCRKNLIGVYVISGKLFKFFSSVNI